MLECEDVDGAFVRFVEILKNAVNQFSREVPVRARNKNHKEWITEELGRLIESKNEMYMRLKKDPHNGTLEDEYKNFRNRVVNLIKTTKNNHYRSRFEEKNKSSEAFWHWLGEVTNSKKCKTCAIKKIKGENLKFVIIRQLEEI
ncbi:hypothetical protein HHI36_010786 [Cryptolaemus montrouzieri]|uniref:Uncharacterized protein n=1 Tax=Cryptolaemus montrouzieri TaxID=559131 RepID=A0ABD2MK39_9CUCU